jgi:hypothetical protein
MKDGDSDTNALIYIGDNDNDVVVTQNTRNNPLVQQLASSSSSSSSSSQSFSFSADSQTKVNKKRNSRDDETKMIEEKRKELMSLSVATLREKMDALLEEGSEDKPLIKGVGNCLPGTVCFILQQSSIAGEMMAVCQVEVDCTTTGEPVTCSEELKYDFVSKHTGNLHKHFCIKRKADKAHLIHYIICLELWLKAKKRKKDLGNQTSVKSFMSRLNTPSEIQATQELAQFFAENNLPYRLVGLRSFKSLIRTLSKALQTNPSYSVSPVALSKEQVFMVLIWVLFVYFFVALFRFYSCSDLRSFLCGLHHFCFIYLRKN